MNVASLDCCPVHREPGEGRGPRGVEEEWTEEGDGGVENFFESGPVGQYQLANHVVLAVLLFPREGQLPGGTSGVVVLLHIFCYFL